ASHLSDGHWRSRLADRVTEERTRSAPGSQRSVKHIDRVGEAIPAQLWITYGHRHFFWYRIPILQEGNDSIRWIVGEAVFALAPLIDEFPGSQVPHDPLGAVRKEQGRGCQPVK